MFLSKMMSSTGNRLADEDPMAVRNADLLLVGRACPVRRGPSPHRSAVLAHISGVLAELFFTFFE